VPSRHGDLIESAMEQYRFYYKRLAKQPVTSPRDP
jgi:hypothetical protein